MGNVSGVKAKFFGPAKTATTTSVAASQAVQASGSFTLIQGAPGAHNDGSGLGAKVNMVSGANLSTINFTITGTDVNGAVITETISGPNATTKPSATTFFSCTSVTVDAAVSACSLGWAATVAGTLGPIFGSRTRVRGLIGISAAGGAVSLEIRNGSSTGPSLFTIPTAGSAYEMDPYIPDDGILFDSGAFLSIPANSATSVTIFYDG